MAVKVVKPVAIVLILAVVTLLLALTAWSIWLILRTEWVVGSLWVAALTLIPRLASRARAADKALGSNWRKKAVILSLPILAAGLLIGHPGLLPWMLCSLTLMIFTHDGYRLPAQNRDHGDDFYGTGVTAKTRPKPPSRGGAIALEWPDTE